MMGELVLASLTGIVSLAIIVIGVKALFAYVPKRTAIVGLAVASTLFAAMVIYIAYFSQ